MILAILHHLGGLMRLLTVWQMNSPRSDSKEKAQMQACKSEIQFYNQISAIYCSVAQSCPTLCDPMNRSTPGFPVLHYIPAFAQTSCLLSQWGHLIILSSVSSSFSGPQSFPTSVSFPVNQLFASDGQRIAASTSVLPMNIQDWFPLGLTGFISLLLKEISRIFPSTTIWKHQFFSTQSCLWSNFHIHLWLLDNIPILLPYFTDHID